jgi:type II secretory pathway pseudopilin PulG
MIDDIYKCSCRRTGLTLIEVTISLILVSTLLLVSITASANLIRSSNRNNTAISASELAGVLLDEIVAMQFADPVSSTDTFGIETDEDVADRTTFDDIDDYHLYSQSAVTYRDGQSIDGFAGWTFQVNVAPATATASGITPTSDVSDPLRLVTVSCNSPSNGTTDVALTRSESILVSQTSDRPTIEQSHERLRALKLQFADGREVSVVSPLLNHPSDLPAAATN